MGGRVAMMAFSGFCVQSNWHWPWAMTTAGDPFPSTNLSPEAQWDAIPEAAKWQIILLAGTFEEDGQGTTPPLTGLEMMFTLSLTCTIPLDSARRWARRRRRGGLPWRLTTGGLR